MGQAMIACMIFCCRRLFLLMLICYDSFFAMPCTWLLSDFGNTNFFEVFRSSIFTRRKQIVSRPGFTGSRRPYYKDAAAITLMPSFWLSSFRSGRFVGDMPSPMPPRHAKMLKRCSSAYELSIAAIALPSIVAYRHGGHFYRVSNDRLLPRKDLRRWHRFLGLRAFADLYGSSSPFCKIDRSTYANVIIFREKLPPCATLLAPDAFTPLMLSSADGDYSLRCCAISAGSRSHPSAPPRAGVAARGPPAR